jgi:phosphate transport system substrate-binding protein
MKKILTLSIAALSALVGLTGCGKKGSQTVAIQNIGSDTMVNLAQSWAEAYRKVQPGVSVEVSGGGSGIGVAALVNGTCDIANSSRHLEPEEEQKATTKYGNKPKEYLVAYDALAIYVHPSNPIETISVEQLSDLYKEGGAIAKWSDLGVTIPGSSDEIVRVSRQNNSGTYHYFREAVLGKKADFRQGSRDMNGSKDVVELVANTPGAIGYSGIGYRTDKVKVIPVSKKKGETPVVPSIKTTLDKTYPIARPMFMYTPPSVRPEVTEYLKWIVTEPGQKIVIDTGYVPLPEFAPKDK